MIHSAEWNLGQQQGLIVRTRLVSKVQRVLMAVLAGIMATLAAPATPASSWTEEQLAPYSMPQLAVHVGKGRTINLVCLGHGSPTVVLTAGLDAWSVWWLAIQPTLAKETRDAYAALSTRGSNRVVDSGHNIPINEPGAVISAVSDVLKQIRPSVPGDP